ncbi:MAG: hypothetical protein J6Z40_07805 [Oscillospiraceae bacterium]|nr:hypothetical protein [Oscillospiraceae bacterium]
MSELQKDGVDSQLEKLYDEIEKKHEKESKKTKAETQMNDIMKGLENPANSRRDGNELLRFFGGLLLFGAGMFMIFQNLIVTSSWGVGSIFRVGGFSIPNGTIMIPLLLGIALLFLCDRKLWGWLFIAVGFVIIIAAVLLSVSISWRTSNGWVFFTMFALTIAGGAMMMRELFRSK